MVDNGLCPLKTGSTRLYVSACDNDATSSKPISTGRDIVDTHTQTNEVSCSVTICGSKCCKTCVSLCAGNTFTSTVTNKRYNVVSPNQSMTCAKANVIYLVTCKRCGIQYVGETRQTLRKRLNNHRNRLKQLSNFYLYQHFTSDGHSEN